MSKNFINNALIFALALSIIASFLKLLHIQGSNTLLLVSLPTLAICAFAKNATTGNIKGVITGAAIAWACIAVLFKLLKWPNGDLMFKGALILGVAWMAYIYFIDKEGKPE